MSIFRKVKVVCPKCKFKKDAEVGCVEKGCDLTLFTCDSCGHNWREKVYKMESADFAKSASSGGFNAEIEQMRAQMAAQFEQMTSLVAKVGKILEERNRVASTFQPVGDDAPAMVVKAVAGAPGGVAFVAEESHTGTAVQKNSPAEAEARANYELQKALANGTPVTIGPSDSGTPPFRTNGMEKVEQAHEELQKALRQGTRVGFVPRG